MAHGSTGVGWGRGGRGIGGAATARKLDQQNQYQHSTAQGDEEEWAGGSWEGVPNTDVGSGETYTMKTVNNTLNFH